MSLFSGVTPIGNVPASFFTVADANGNVVQPALLTHGGDSFDLGGEVGTANTDQDPLIFGEMGNGFLGTLPNPSALIEGIYYVDDLGVAIVPTAMSPILDRPPACYQASPESLTDFSTILFGGPGGPNC